MTYCPGLHEAEGRPADTLVHSTNPFMTILASFVARFTWDFMMNDNALDPLSQVPPHLSPGRIWPHFKTDQDIMRAIFQILPTASNWSDFDLLSRFPVCDMPSRYSTHNKPAPGG
jgi:hypothetical protein